MDRRIRPAAVAGRWYPATATALAAAVDAHLAAAAEPLSAFGGITAFVVPHAGLIYSGRVAAHAYRLLQGCEPELVVLVGPSHFIAFEGVSIVRAGWFETPLGAVEIDQDCAEAIMAAGSDVREFPAAHAREHSIEMQLPFLRRVAPRATIVPLVMGTQTAEMALRLSEALGTALAGRNVLLVASTDLSHYQNAATAARLDQVVIDHVSRFDPDGLQRSLDARPEHACGGGPTVAVLRAARVLGARDAAVLMYADSGDVSGDKSAVVGYLAAVLGHSTGECERPAPPVSLHRRVASGERGPGETPG